MLVIMDHVTYFMCILVSYAFMGLKYCFGCESKPRMMDSSILPSISPWNKPIFLTSRASAVTTPRTIRRVLHYMIRLQNERVEIRHSLSRFRSSNNLNLIAFIDPMKGLSGLSRNAGSSRTHHVGASSNRSLTL